MTEYVTHSDLNDCKEAVGDRIQEHHINVALLKQSQATMTKELIDLKKEQHEGFAKIEMLINNLDHKYATKTENIANTHKIAKIENGIWWVIALVGSILISAVIYTILK